MLKIGEFSKLTRVGIRMLRHYDEIGLLHPLETDVLTGYRYYSEKQLPVAARIAAFKDMGFGLTDICTLLGGYEDKAALEAHLLDKGKSFAACSFRRKTGYGDEWGRRLGDGQRICV